MRWLLLILALPVQAQNLAEPMYNLPGTSYESETPAIQDMFKNLGGEVQALKKSLADTQATASQVSTASNTFSTVNVSSSLRVNPGAFLEYGAPAAVNPLNVGQGVYWATSLDGASQSSGCVVAVYFSSGSADGAMRFTSSTTIWNSVDQTTGVLLESCAPSRPCRVATSGIYRLQAGPLIGDADFITPSTTRCKVAGVGTWDGTVFGRKMTGQAGVSPSEFLWVSFDR